MLARGVIAIVIHGKQSVDIETAWYELSPYIYIVVGAAAIFYASESLARLPGMLLIVAALTIIRLRWVHRRAADAKVARAHDLAQGKVKLPGVDAPAHIEK